MPDEDRQAEIEVGAAEGTLRLWKAREALRQGELRLAAQAAIRTALEARATALTGWTAAALLALAAAAAAAPVWPPRIAASVAGAVLFSAAAVSIHAARPRDWGIAGYGPQVILDDKLQTELEIVESLAFGIAPVIQTNATRIDAMARAIRRAGTLLLLAPLIGAVTYAALTNGPAWWQR